MNDESADILGSKSVPRVLPRPSNSSLWSSVSFNVKFTFFLAALLVTYVAFIRVWGWVLRWKERSYKLSVRRRHGIPDSDHRPFNVAYAAVLRTRQENDAANRTKELVQQASYERLPQDAPPAQNIRQHTGPQRNLDAPWSHTTGRLPGQLDRDVDLTARFSRHRNAATSNGPSVQYNAKVSNNHLADMQIPSSSRIPNGSHRHSSRKDIFANTPSVDHKQRIAGGAEESDFLSSSMVDDNQVDDDEILVQSFAKRVSKRGLGDSEDADDQYGDRDEASGPSKHKRDKRARQVSSHRLSVDPTSGDEMVIDDEDQDELADLKPISRGKKRDRTEAGSTFGGEDSESSQDERSSVSRIRRTRKRRVFSKRKSDAKFSRGTKRDRNVEEDSEESDGYGKRKSRIKRGKRGSILPDNGSSGRGSDLSVDDSVISSHPSCKGRRVGEEWARNGVRYKVGPNGDRLRQALVRQERHKFIMPEDSQHPDRDANLEVIVETWLTEDEYKAAKDQQLLAWQDLLNTSVNAETSQPEAAVRSKPPTAGKQLLWADPPTPTHRRYSSPLQTQNSLRDPFRQSIATNLGLRVNPFQQPPQPSFQSRRIATPARIASPNPTLLMHSISGSSTPGLTDSTNNLGARGSPRRTFSKWEKQDLEAQAMRKMREAAKKKEQESEEKERKEREEKEKLEKKAAAAKPVSTLVFSKPAEDKPAATENKPTFSFSAPQALSTDVSQTSSVDIGKPGAFSLPTSASSPSLATQSKPAVALNPFAGLTRASMSTASPFTAPAATSSTITSDPFTAPSGTAATSSTPAAPTFSFSTPPASSPASSSISNFFAKPTGSLSTNTIGSTTESKLAPPKFSFNSANTATTPNTLGSTADSKPAPPKFTFGVPSSTSGNAASVTNKSANATEAKPAAPKFSFSPPTNTNTSAPSARLAGGFSFGIPANQSAGAATLKPSTGEKNAPVQSAATQNPSGGSLLNRLEGLSGTQSSAPAQTSSAATTRPVFSFANPAGADAAKSTSSFGATSSTASSGNLPSSMDSTTTSKFSFSAGTRPINATNNTNVRDAMKTSSIVSTQAASGFGQPKQDNATEAKPEGTVNSGSGASVKFSFNTPSSGFVNTNTIPAATGNSQILKPVFSGFGATPFGSSSTISSSEPAKSMFSGNAPGASSAFGSSGFSFGDGGSSSKPAETPAKLAFSSANPSSTPAFNVSSNPTLSFSVTPTPAKSFSFSAPSTTPTGDPPKPATSFGNLSANTTSFTSSTTPAPTTTAGISGFPNIGDASNKNSTTPQSLPFGTPASGSTQSIFGGAGPSTLNFTSTSNASGGTSIFGATTASTSQNQQ